VRELDRPVLHIALDKPPHAAALVEGGAFVHDAKGWREELLPPNLRESKALALKVFFGRDYRIRVVGGDSASGNVESVYLRWLPGGLRSAFDEIGRLGNTRRGPLVAVLGTADPELVCRPAEACLVKRISGWKQLPAAANLAQVAITNEQGFAIVGQQLLRADQEWRPVGTLGPWREAGPLFVIGERAFVLEPGRKLVHALDRAGTWASLDSPVGAPRALWGAAEDALWLAGEHGIARHDGKVWQSVVDGPSDVRAVLGRSGDDVWFGAGSGLYRLEAVGAGS
jgi:hypothetical protein